MLPLCLTLGRVLGCWSAGGRGGGGGGWGCSTSSGSPGGPDPPQFLRIQPPPRMGLVCGRREDTALCTSSLVSRPHSSRQAWEKRVPQPHFQPLLPPLSPLSHRAHIESFSLESDGSKPWRVLCPAERLQSPQRGPGDHWGLPAVGAGAKSSFSQPRHRPPAAALHGPAADLAGAAACGCQTLLTNKAPGANFNAVVEILTLDKYLKSHRLKTHVNLQHKCFKGAAFPLASPHLPGTHCGSSPLPAAYVTAAQLAWARTYSKDLTSC